MAAVLSKRRAWLGGTRFGVHLSFWVLACGLALAGAATAQPKELDASHTWKVDASFSQDAVGQGLPVLLLGGDSWPQYRIGRPSTARAALWARAELVATHSSGWRFGTIARQEAALSASADTVDLAVAYVTASNPGVTRSFQLATQARQWRASGLKLGTPWLALNSTESLKWQADIQYLQLRNLETTSAAGVVKYQGNGVYDLDLHAEQANQGVTGPFLAASNTSGWGASLSGQLAAELAPQLWFTLAVDDLLSTLQWSGLATDTSVIQSATVTRAADGSLDYGPLRKGRQYLSDIRTEIGAGVTAKLSWRPSPSGTQTGAATMRYARKYDLEQLWLGWDAERPEVLGLAWSAELEPQLGALALRLRGTHWSLAWAGDGRGAASQYTRTMVAWTGSF